VRDPTAAALCDVILLFVVLIDALFVACSAHHL
jgi:hypothetical protein